MGDRDQLDPRVRRSAFERWQEHVNDRAKGLWGAGLRPRTEPRGRGLAQLIAYGLVLAAIPFVLVLLFWLQMLLR
jgi:hypothetical protein